MSISQEWTKAIRDVRGVFLAIRTSLGFAWAGKRGNVAKLRTAHVAVRSALITDHRVLAELERRKNLVFLNNSRNLVR